MSCVQLSEGVSSWFTPYACGPGQPELPKSFSDMASTLLFITYTVTQVALQIVQLLVWLWRNAWQHDIGDVIPLPGTCGCERMPCILPRHHKPVFVCIETWLHYTLPLNTPHV